MHILIGDEKVFPNDKDLIVIRPYKKDEKIRDDSFQHVEILGILIGGKTYKEAYSSTSFSNEMFRKLNCTDLKDEQKEVINNYFSSLHDEIMKVLLPELKKTSKIIDLEPYYFIQRNDIQIPPDTVYNSIYKVRMFNKSFYYITAILGKKKVIGLFSKHRALYHCLHTIGEITKTMSILIPLSTDVEDLTKQMDAVKISQKPSSARAAVTGVSNLFHNFMDKVGLRSRPELDAQPAAPQPTASQPAAPQPTASQPAAPQPTASQPAAPQTTAPQTTAHALVNEVRRRPEPDVESGYDTAESSPDDDTVSENASTDPNLVFEDVSTRKITQFVQIKRKLPENLEWLHARFVSDEEELLFKKSQKKTLQFVATGAEEQELNINVYYVGHNQPVMEYNYSNPTRSLADYRFYFDVKNMLRKITKVPVDVDED